MGEGKACWRGKGLYILLLCHILHKLKRGILSQEERGKSKEREGGMQRGEGNIEKGKDKYGVMDLEKRGGVFIYEGERGKINNFL